MSNRLLLLLCLSFILTSCSLLKSASKRATDRAEKIARLHPTEFARVSKEFFPIDTTFIKGRIDTLIRKDTVQIPADTGAITDVVDWVYEQQGQKYSRAQVDSITQAYLRKHPSSPRIVIVPGKDYRSTDTILKRDMRDSVIYAGTIKELTSKTVSLEKKLSRRNTWMLVLGIVAIISLIAALIAILAAKGARASTLVVRQEPAPIPIQPVNPPVIAAPRKVRKPVKKKPPA